MITIRGFFSPLVAVGTLALGVACVESFAILRSFFSEPVAVARAAEPLGYGFGSAEGKRIDFSAPEQTGGRPVLSCYDVNILPIWHELKKVGEFDDRIKYSDEALDCSDLVEINKVDLNRDRNEEFLVGGKDSQLCSSVGHCGFWVFEVKHGRARTLLAASDYMDISELGDQVQKTRTRSYHDLLLKGHHSISQTSYSTYKFDGRRYVETRCVYEVPKNVRRAEGAWTLVNCEEFDRHAD